MCSAPLELETAILKMIKKIVSHLMLSSLKRGFRRICWVGPQPAFDKNLPVIAYANHHSFYDGYVMWLLATRMLNRTPMLWMEEWRRFPFFAAVGAYPFPADDNRTRLRTIRQTAKRMDDDPGSFLIYFPEGKLHSPEAGILPIAAGSFERLDRIFPEKYWWPVRIHMTSHGEDRPTLLLSGGKPHRSATGNEVQLLEHKLNYLRNEPHNCSHLLLEGKKSEQETWDMGFMAGWFERYLR